jgi:hypothetical protein
MKRSFFLFIFFILIGPVYTQEDENLDEALENGHFFFLAEDYTEAVFHLLKLKNTEYMNANINYKIGYCYLNIPGEEYQAISNLEEAIQNTTAKYKSRSISEEKAPLHAYFWLGRAYHINNELDKALETYNSFKELPEFEDNYNLDIINNQIKSCEKAKIIQDIPVKIREENLGEVINNASSNYHPVISWDESILAFMNEERFYNAVYVSRKREGKWEEPVNITPQIGSDGDCVPACFSPDGNQLYLVKGEKNNRDIYISRFVEGFWTSMEPLNEKINSNRAETHASISPNGKTLYFTSNRRGGQGELDIYKATMNPSGDWDLVTGLGPEINTPFDEESPFISQDDSILYFTSIGHYNMGGFDIFYSEKTTDNNWLSPINIGFPINTTGDDLLYSPVGNGTIGYMSKIEPDGFGDKDIYRIEILPQEGKAITEKFEGLIDMKGKTIQIDKNFSIKVIDKTTKKIIAIIYYDKKSGEFTYTTYSGNYTFSFQEE